MKYTITTKKDFIVLHKDGVNMRIEKDELSDVIALLERMWEKEND